MDKPERKKLSAWVESETWKAFRRDAVERETTVSEMIREALAARFPKLMTREG